MVSGRWEQAAERGLGRIAAEFDADVERRRAPGDGDSVPLLSEIADSAVDVVFCVGSGLENDVFRTAASRPDTVFVLLPGRTYETNVAAVEFLSEGAGYVAGAVAASLAPGDRVGIVRGVGGPWLESLEEGFAAGFRSRRPRADVVTAAGVDGVDGLREAGVDLALYATDRSENAVLEAASQSGIRLVASDVELMASMPDLVEAAVEVDVPEAMLRVAREVHDGTFVSRVFAFDLGSGVLDVLVSSALEGDRRKAALESLETARSEVTAGIVEIEELGL
jgi:basic membrane lipoprotein Med (substrate-binding protein (PBP1-ABC) superfamily)